MPVITNFNCPNCGAPLKNIRNAVGNCEYCNSPYMIEGIQQYQSAVSSEKITSGVSFTAESAAVRNHILNFLTSNPAAPLDILSAVEVKEVLPIVIPSYYYHYNGTSDFMCDIGNKNTKYVSAKEGGAQAVTETTWSTITGNTRTDAQGIVSGNSEYDAIINAMYSPYASGSLTDVENLQIPFDAETLKFTRPSSAVLSDFITPLMHEELKKSAITQIGDRLYRNLTLGNPNISSDREIEKVLVGAYKILMSYQNHDYLMYVSADGMKTCVLTDAPIDAARWQYITDLTAKLAEVTNKKSWITKGLIAAGVVGAIFLLAKNILLIILCALAIGACIYFLAQLTPEIDKLANELEEEKQKINQIREEFFQQGSTFKGLEGKI